MSFLSNAFKVLTGGAGAIADVVTGTAALVTGRPDVAAGKAQKFVADTAKFLAGSAGLGVELGSTAQKFIDNPFVKISDSPPLNAAQLAILTMRGTTGFGEPKDGSDFKQSAKLYEESLNIYLDAKPRPDRWDGTAATEYAKRDQEQKDRANFLYSADYNMIGILNDEATHVGQTREKLDEWSRYLWDFGLATAAIGLAGPAGRAAQLVLDSGAAATALEETGRAMWDLHQSVSGNAVAVREQAEYYRKANQDVTKGGACQPFGPERSQLPTRLNPPVPDQVPAPEEPPNPYPPATPYGATPPTQRGTHVGI